MSETTRYPLCWPDGWKRTTSRSEAQFGKTNTSFNSQLGRTTYRGKSRLSIGDAVSRLERELRATGANESSVIISTNLPTSVAGVLRGDRGEPGDPGVAVYWERKEKKQCMAIDRYSRVADNIAAIAATLEALRAIERHGGGAILDRAFAGFAQLPASTVTPRSWREILGFPLDAVVGLDEVEARYVTLMKIHHPDKGPATEQRDREDRARELNDARSRARAELRPRAATA